MKKNDFLYLSPWRWILKKWYWAMKLSFILTLCFSLPAFSSGFCQKENISLVAEDMQIEEIIHRVREQTGYKFLYNHEDLRTAGKKSVHLKSKSIYQVMDEVLEGTPLKYKVEEDVIVISLKTQQNPQKIVTVTGSVTDRHKVPLPGVTVLIKDTSVGVITDENGHFKITVPDHKEVILVFSFVGMKSKKVVLHDEKVLNIVLEEEVREMEEVVVTGIFKKSKESYTGAVSVITEKELKSYGNRNILTTLRNIDPSFNVIENNAWGSNPNKLPEIEIRGAASMPDVDQLQSDMKAELNTPLIIMDGFEISLQRMMDLDDNEVRSVTLLKDASATAIYGSRGANGVVVIETKEPEMGRLKFSYTGSLNVEIPDLSDYDLLNAREKLALEYESGYYNDKMPATDIQLKQKYSEILQQIERGVDTYWLSKPLRTGIGHRHNVKLEGGDKSFRYAVTLQYNHIAGVMKGSNRNNFNGGINLSYKHAKFIFRNSLSISLNKSEDSPYGSFDQYVKLNPYWTEKDENGNIRKFFDEDYFYWGTNYPANPLYNATLNTRVTTDYLNVTNNFSMEWRPVQSLILRGNFGIYTQTDNRDSYFPPEHTQYQNYTGDDYFRKGSYTYTTGKNYRYNASFTINYNKVFAEKHMIYAGVNMDVENSEGHSYTFSAEGFPSGALDFLAAAMQYKKDGKPSGNESKSRRVGIVANANYSFHDRFFVDGSYRTDGSSLYGADRRFAGFWSVGLGWNIHREAFMENVNFVDRLKLRGSVGETGSNNFSSYEALATYKYVLNDRYYQWMGATQQALANPELEWQKTMKYNIGLELNVFDKRLSIIGDVYLERTSGLMSSLDLPPSNGYPSYKANIGKLENKGFELRATAFIFRDTEKRLTWSVTAALMHNKDKIIELSENMKKKQEQLLNTAGSVPNQVWKEGDPMNAIYAVPSLGIDPSTGKELYLRKNGEVSYNWYASDRVFCGVSQPKFRGNINTMFRFRDISLNMSFGYRWGGQQYNSTLINRVENADKKYNVDRRVYEDRWVHAGDKTFFKGIKETSQTYSTSRFVQDETTFMCQNLNLTYELRQNKWIKQHLGVDNLALKGNIADLFRISTIKQERGTSYPFSRQFSFSLTAVF